MNVMPIVRDETCPRDRLYVIPEATALLQAGIYVHPSDRRTDAEIEHAAVRLLWNLHTAGGHHAG